MKYIKKYNENKDIETIQAKIRNKLSLYWNLVGMIDNIDKNENVLKYVKQSAKKIKESQDELLELINKTKQNWIDINDEQPKNSEFVLTYNKHNGIEINRDLNMSWENVTHWIPLPEKPY